MPNTLPGLVLIEGIMGAGKTTTAQFVESELQRLGAGTELYLEGNLSHPADYDGVAVLDANLAADLEADFLEHFQQKYPKVRQTIEHFTQVAPGIYAPGISALGTSNESLHLIHYRKARQELGEEGMPDELMGALARYDIYDGVSLDTHKAILLESWKQFGAHQAGRGQGCKTSSCITSYSTPDTTSYIFDCAFLQNPVCKFIAMHNAGKDALEEHILKMAEAILPLRPILIYLYPTNVRETLERVIPQRPKEWLDAVIEYHTSQEYGKAHHLEGKGLDGLIEFLERRQEIEIKVCTRLPFPVKIVANPHKDWDKAKREMAQFIEEAY